MNKTAKTDTICKFEIVGGNFNFSIAIKSKKDLEIVEFFIDTIRKNLSEVRIVK